MFFTLVHKMEDDNCMEGTPCDLTKPRIAPYKNTWKPLQNTVYLCNLKLAQEKGLQFYQARSHAIVLCNTLPAVSIEKVVCMKTEEELYHKVRLAPRLQRVLYSNRIRTPVNKNNENKTQEHLVTNPAGKLGTTPWTTEALAYTFPQSNSRIQIAKTRPKSRLSISRNRRSSSPT